jgi:hypothetical protein
MSNDRKDRGVFADIDVDRDSAIRAGNSAFGEQKMAVDVAALTPVEREELLRCPYYDAGASVTYSPQRYRKSQYATNERISGLPVATAADMDTLRALLAARGPALAAMAGEKAAKREQSILDALAAPIEDWLGPWKATVPGYDPDLKSDPRIAARFAQAQSVWEQKEAVRKAEQAAREAANKAEALAALAEKEAWIAQHGSARLKRMLAERIQHEAVYEDERLAIERPGWSYDTDQNLEIREPRNPTDAAFDLLDRARVLEPTAGLRYYRLIADDEYEGKSVKERGYVCYARFLGDPIITDERVVIEG